MAAGTHAKGRWRALFAGYAPLLTMLDDAGGSILHRLELASSQEMLVVGKRIARRVRNEVAACDELHSGAFQRLVQPIKSEKALSGHRPRPQHLIDAERQVYRAPAACPAGEQLK